MTDRCEPPSEMIYMNKWHWVQPLNKSELPWMLRWEPVYQEWRDDDNENFRMSSDYYGYLGPVTPYVDVEALREALQAATGEAGSLKLSANEVRTIAQAWAKDTIERDALRAEVERLREWQPIETAPKDGTPLVLIGLYPDGKSWSDQYQCWWQYDPHADGTWVRWVHNIDRTPPTHWRPLPAPPAQEPEV